MICPNCGFHNAPGEEFCGSCGERLATAPRRDALPGPAGPPLGPAEPPLGPVEPEPAPPADPYAMTRTIPVNFPPCWNCGATNEPTRTFCQACGQQLRQARTRRWRAVGLGGGPAAGGAAAGGTAGLPPRAAAGGTVAGPDATDRASPARVAERSRAYVVLALGGAVVVLLLLGAAVLGGLLGGGGALPPGASTPPLVGASGDEVGRPSGTAASGSPPASAGPTGDSASPGGEPAPTGDVTGRFRCETQTLSAPTAGRYEVRTVRWGNRAAFDYVTFNLRRRGSSDDTGSVTAELVPLDAVEERFGFPAPGRGDIALIVSFDGPIGLVDSFGRDIGQRVLREFRLRRQDGRTHAALGVAGTGCFELRAPQWEEGSNGNASVTINLGR